MWFEGHKFEAPPSEELLESMRSLYNRYRISRLLLALAQCVEEELEGDRGAKPKVDTVMEETVYQLRSLAVQEDIADNL